MKKIVLAGGGSAGHVMPALAVAEALPEFKAFFIGGGGIERDILKGYNDIEYSEIAPPKLRRGFYLSNLLIPFKLFKAVRSAKRILREIKPDAVFSKGGFVGLPVVIAAHKLKIPAVAHESDMSAGLANKISKRFCTKICATFADAAEEFGEKGVFTGSAIRRGIYKGDKKKAEKFPDNTKPVLLAAGGSLGAAAVNKTLREILPALTKKFNVCHIVGCGNVDGSIKNLSYRQIEFTDKIADLFASASLAVSRAGSNSVCELLALKIPALLIPLPRAASRGDQILNARYFEERNIAYVLPQEDMTPETLLSAIENLYKERHALIKNLNAAENIDGTEKIAEVIKSAVTM